MKELLDHLNAYEDQIGATTDAIIHKAMQEWLEFVEALQQYNIEAIISEAGDAISNILSAHHRTNENQNYQIEEIASQTTPLEFAINLGKWNDSLQKYRNIYSRTSVSSEELTAITQKNISQILWLVKEYTNQELTINDVLAQQSTKFEQRLDTYTNNINISDFIEDIPDFPKKGILFKDISPLLKNNKARSYVVQQLALKAKDADIIAGLDARWFIFGSMVAQYLQKPFVMIRKKGKLPGNVIEENYTLEYGNNIQEIQTKSVEPNQKVAIIDDLLATGGTAASAARLVEKLWGIVQWCHFVVELEDLQGKEKIKNYPISSLVSY
jgi:adenine phosphoribosyltransferase